VRKCFVCVGDRVSCPPLEGGGLGPRAIFCGILQWPVGMCVWEGMEKVCAGRFRHGPGRGGMGVGHWPWQQGDFR